MTSRAKARSKADPSVALGSLRMTVLSLLLLEDYWLPVVMECQTAIHSPLLRIFSRHVFVCREDGEGDGEGAEDHADQHASGQVVRDDGLVSATQELQEIDGFGCRLRVGSQRAQVGHDRDHL